MLAFFSVQLEMNSFVEREDGESAEKVQVVHFLQRLADFQARRFVNGERPT